MAEINTEGLEALSYAFLRLEEGATAAVEEMLQAEADIYKEQLQQAAAGYGIKKTGGFINSIKIGETQQEDTAVYKIIAPEGRAEQTIQQTMAAAIATKRTKEKARAAREMCVMQLLALFLSMAQAHYRRARGGRKATKRQKNQRKIRQWKSTTDT